jgi:hypothetical protein
VRGWLKAVLSPRLKGQGSAPGHDIPDGAVQETLQLGVRPCWTGMQQSSSPARGPKLLPGVQPGYQTFMTM